MTQTPISVFDQCLTELYMDTITAHKKRLVCAAMTVCWWYRHAYHKIKWDLSVYKKQQMVWSEPVGARWGTAGGNISDKSALCTVCSAARWELSQRFKINSGTSSCNLRLFGVMDVKNETLFRPWLRLLDRLDTVPLYLDWRAQRIVL